MSVAGASLIDQAAAKMRWLAARQRVIAENVANADTPGFRPRDLTTLSDPAGALTLASTAPGHLAGGFDASGAQTRRGPSFETRQSGAAVSIEEEMLKLSATQVEFQAASSIYSKSFGLMRIALGKRA